MQPVVVPPKKFDRKAMQTQVDFPVKEITYPFQWLVYKPQIHAMAPFPTNQQTRLDNTEIKNTK